MRCLFLFVFDLRSQLVTSSRPTTRRLLRIVFITACSLGLLLCVSRAFMYKHHSDLEQFYQTGAYVLALRNEPKLAEDWLLLSSQHARLKSLGRQDINTIVALIGFLVMTLILHILVPGRKKIEVTNHLDSAFVFINRMFSWIAIAILLSTAVAFIIYVIMLCFVVAGSD